MNIFVTNPCPRKSAEYLDDRRCIKMVLETAQLLSTVIRHYGYEDSTIYKSTHLNHPCSIWARATRNNYRWLVEHGLALCAEYTNRYNKVHKSQAIIERLAMLDDLLPEGEQQSFVNCTPYKDLTDVYQAYKLTLADKWLNDNNPKRYKKPILLKGN